MSSMTEELKYFYYLKERSFFGFLFRRYLLSPIVKEFKGKVLDIGCGIGEFLGLYRNSVGIDTNKYCVNYCKEKGFDAVLGNVEKIPFKNGTFNGVICSHVFEHLLRPDKAISEMRRVLKKRGKLIITVPDEKAFKKDKSHKIFWNEDNLSVLFKKHKFKITKKFFLPLNNRAISKLLGNGEFTIVGVKN